MAVEHRRTRMTRMSWEGLAMENEDDGDFYDSNNRISAMIPFDFVASSESSDDDATFEDPRSSFASAVSTDGHPRISSAHSPEEDYEMWLLTPASITERRRRLFKGLGLNSSRELLKLTTMPNSNKLNHSFQNKDGGHQKKPSLVNVTPGLAQDDHSTSDRNEPEPEPEPEPELYSMSPSPDKPFLVRSRSDGDIDEFSIETRRRKEQLIGNVSKQRLTRTSSTVAPFPRASNFNIDSSANGYSTISNKTNNSHISSGSKSSGRVTSSSESNNQQQSDQFGAFFLIKNLDTGKEFIVKEFANDGMWNRLRDLQTGRQLTMEEFEKSVGYSPVVKELMRRQIGGALSMDEGGSTFQRKSSVNGFLSKRFLFSKRRGAALLKSINKVTHLGSISEKERENSPEKGSKSDTAERENKEWVRVRTHGKPYKELTALRFCQEIQAHQGSIWTIQFNADGRYLASAGEDRVIHVWEVQECEVGLLRASDQDSTNSTPTHPLFCPTPDRGDHSPLPLDLLSSLEKRKKGRSGGLMPDYVRLPETTFALSNEPICSLEGHLDDVLDLSWSKSQLLLLSSSMDKTVRLWDLEKKACLRLFPHNDYVTCIQFNPVNDDYFISGALDAKVRIWNVPDRRIVDWTDINEMVTAACYTPDGQGAVVGSHKGNIRMYNVSDGRLNQTSQFVIQTKKKSGPKKITGFEFTADNPDDVLVTSADSRIRIYKGSELTQKFKGLRNTSSQIAASFSPDGKYVICASEDSNVYLWKQEEQRNGKSKGTIRTNSHEYFHCKDVSVAIPWPGSIKFEPPTVQLHSKRHSKRHTALPFSSFGSPKKGEVNKNSKRHLLPPLPSKRDNNNPTYSKNNEKNVDHMGKGSNSSESDSAQVMRSESGFSYSFDSSGVEGFLRHGDSPSINSNYNSSLSSWAPGWSWFDGAGSHGGGEAVQARAWGLVIVTAGLGGEIRAYQNIGIPVKVGR